MKTSFKLGFVAILIGSLTAVGVASAAPLAGRPGRPDPTVFDTNKDGVLDGKEREAMHAARKAERAKMIAAFDANKDGVLDDKEKEAMFQARVADHFKQLDKDGNGVLSLDEFKAGAPKGGHGGKGRHHRGPGRGHGGRGHGPGGGFGGGPDGGNDDAP